MFLACLTIPAHILEEDLERLGPALEGLYSGFYASREREDDETSPWLTRWILEKHPDLSDISIRVNIWCESQDITLSISEHDWDVEKIDENKDWLAESYQGFQPFEIASFYIYGSHYEGEMPSDKILLQIDAATAFGSGEHPTTAGCLKILDQMKRDNISPSNILDMGCGSGILAVAAAKLFESSQIIASDIDEEAVVVTKRHQDLNNISDTRILSASGNGFETDIVQKHAPYDLVIANILAAPLKDMSQDLISVTAKAGYVILSGLLNEQADDIKQCYSDLEVISHLEIEEWSAILFQKKV